MSEMKKVRCALISVSDKAGIVEFASALFEFGVKIISTGGTAAALRSAGLDVTEISEVTGFPEMMGGRVKTLHPKVHGALLALRDDPDHISAMQAHGIEPIDLVVVNLYPFEQTVARDGVTLEEAIENIDIGGPAMIRSASKNWRDVAVVTDPRLYETVITEMRENEGSLLRSTRQRLATLAYTRTASYDLAVSSYLAGRLSDEDLEFLEPLNPLGNLIIIESEELSADEAEETEEQHPDEFPPAIGMEFAKVTDLRYGENPHQKAALYSSAEGGGLVGAEQLHGKEMSFNNYVDAEAAWELVNDLDGTAVAIIKHTNPSGVGLGETNEQAYRRALSTDPISAFGGIVAFNTKVDQRVASSVNEVFTEVVIAPDYEPEAIRIFMEKKNVRVLKARRASDDISEMRFKQISGGMLVQTKDLDTLTERDLTIVTKTAPTEEQVRALLLAWKVCRHVKSNAIVLANGNQTLGVGAGQMNRVDSLRIAAMRAERFTLPLAGSALASDAFFPFRDSVDEAAKLGVGAIIQPGGSVRDDESIEAADEHGIAMAFTGVRHFNH
jgi:phosphoribosylaminoimidazolecarboxamide formyltransferase / IMP cyclohydrolase